MSRRVSVLAASLVVCAALAACSSDTASPIAPDVLFAKSGTAPSGGGGTGGGSTGGGSSSTDSTGTAVQAGPPVAPSYTAKITKMGVVPTGFYYGAPSDWEVGGYHFAAGYATNYKPVNGPIVLGACVVITFYDTPGDRFMTEMKTLSASKCQ